MKKPPTKRAPEPNSPPPENRQVTTAAWWQGPLPPPAALQGFDDVVPGLAERIARAWEVESAHRREIEKSDQRGFYRDLTHSKIQALVFVLSALGLAGFCAWLDQPWLGGILGGGTLAGVVWAFVRSQQRNKS